MSPATIDRAIVPAIAFDRGHARLGNGKGFYDRFLSKLSCLS
ncbi:MAG: 5-formyltetrahydrofolate cyclo-ligase, partial [Chlamydiota bacterium]